MYVSYSTTADKFLNDRSPLFYKDTIPVKYVNIFLAQHLALLLRFSGSSPHTLLLLSVSFLISYISGKYLVRTDLFCNIAITICDYFIIIILTLL